MENRRVLWFQPDKTGFLLKRGGDVRSWKSRYFVLKESSLFYFKSRGDLSSPCGLIPLEGAIVEPQLGALAEKHEHAFSITLPKAKGSDNSADGLVPTVKRDLYLLAAEDSAAFNTWIDALKSAVMSKTQLHHTLDRLREDLIRKEDQLATLSRQGLEQPASPAQTEEKKRALQAAKDEGAALQDQLAKLSQKLNEQRPRLQIGQTESKPGPTDGPPGHPVPGSGGKPGDQIMTRFQKQTEAVDQCVNWLLAAWKYLYALDAEVLFLSTGGKQGKGNQASVVQTLQATLLKLDKLRDGPAGAETLVKESDLASLHLVMDRLVGRC
eukprot:jgi/Mesvir1/7930/Mv11852-RA.1